MASSLHAKYGLKRVINASGRMSILGVSAPSDPVMEAMKQGGQMYVEMADLADKAGRYIAGRLGAEAAAVVNSASSGIALSVAALVTRGDRRRSERLHQDGIARNEIILLKGHNVQYGAPVETMVYLGGGRVVEAGYANEGRAEHIEAAVGENTAGILYVQSHHAVQKNMITAKEAWETARKCGVPLIIDAAAEEDLRKYAAMADLAIYSGSKAIGGPTSGIVAGRRTYIEWLNTQFYGIGRSMKVGKETIFGLLQALDEYFVKEDRSAQEKESLQAFLPLNRIRGVKVTIVRDETGRAICRARIQIDPAEAKLTAQEAAAKLRDGDIAIYTRDYGVKQGYFEIDPRPLQQGDLEVIVSRLRELLEGE
jgi:L-seryl-tRNA(Ser) seleniumtransferase